MSELLKTLFDGDGRTEQQTLPEMRAAVSHSNLGKQLEDALNRTHHRYAIQKLAHLKQNPKMWVYSTKKKYDYLKTTGGKSTVARVADNSFLQLKKSDVDFSGNVGARHIAFDAKQTREKSFPLKNVERHQIENLLLTEKCGGIAGLMIWLSEINRMFFVSASFAADCFDAMLFKQGRSSISLQQMIDSAIEIPVHKDLREVDWLPHLITRQK